MRVTQRLNLAYLSGRQTIICITPQTFKLHFTETFRSRRFFQRYIYMYLKVELLNKTWLFCDSKFHAYAIIRQILILLISSTFRYTTLCERIEHFTAKIDYNQDIHIIVLSSKSFNWVSPIILLPFRWVITVSFLPAIGPGNISYVACFISVLHIFAKETRALIQSNWGGGVH